LGSSTWLVAGNTASMCQGVTSESEFGSAPAL
jgi:hypothetical protein